MDKKVHRIYSMSVVSVYKLYIQKVEKKGRTATELEAVTCWLTGYTPAQLRVQLDQEVNFEQFFADAPHMNPARRKITGLICGVRVEDIKEPTMQNIRYLDKLVDELAKGRQLHKVLREEG